MVVVLFSVLVIGAPWPSEAQQPISVVASLSLTGTDASFGSYAQEGYLPCRQRVNEKRASLGRPIGSVIYDDHSDEQTAVRRYEKLVTEAEVDAVIAGLLLDPRRDLEAPDQDPPRRICGG